MGRNNFFFERKEFSEDKIKRSYYSYRGYVREKSSEEQDPYPVSLYFGKDEIAIYYTKTDGNVFKVFSLYVGEGEINQAMLSKKIEDYALMPLWPLSDNLSDEKLRIDPNLLQLSFFCSFYGFEYDGKSKQVKEVTLAGSAQERIKVEGNQLKVTYGNDKKNDRPNLLRKLPTRLTCISGNDKKKDKLIANGLTDGKKEGSGVDVWKIDEGVIKTSRINFLMILLDFLFELDFANTFEDSNFYQLQPILQNNLVLDALTKKSRYLSELNKLRTKEEDLPKLFQDAETDWLNVCRLEQYKHVFVSPHTLFQDPEVEVKKIFFEAEIGKGNNKRKKYFGEDVQLKNDVITFFMRKYNIGNAFRVFFTASSVNKPIWQISLTASLLACLIITLILIVSNPNKTYNVLLSVILFFFLYLMLLYLITTGINAFKLIMPRLFFGIIIGWGLILTTEEIFIKIVPNMKWPAILILNTCLGILIFLFIYSSIENQLYIKEPKRIISKSLIFVLVAFLISIIVGVFSVHIYGQYNVSDQSGLSPYKVLSQFVAVLFVGVILQMLWEDRPITEPL